MTMATDRWRVKRTATGRVVPDCWQSEDGYTVALCRLPQNRFTVTRPGSPVPFAYLGTREEVLQALTADRLARAGNGATEHSARACGGAVGCQLCADEKAAPVGGQHG